MTEPTAGEFVDKVQRQGIAYSGGMRFEYIGEINLKDWAVSLDGVIE